MLYRKMLSFAVVLCCFLIVDASLRKSKSEDVSSKRQSHNEIPYEKQQSREAEQLYYLPLQTEFDVTEVLMAAGGLTTSPPQLAIKPAPIQTGFQESTSVFNEEPHHFKASHLESLCISETPASELQSIIVASSSLSKKGVILAGHLEVASKTSSLEDIHDFVTQPSIALQGTMVHSHPASDL